MYGADWFQYATRKVRLINTLEKFLLLLRDLKSDRDIQPCAAGGQFRRKWYTG